jgi:RecB family exonuclease
VVAGRVAAPARPDQPMGAGAALAVTAAAETAALLDEERRLFYTAVTRARRHVVVTAQHSGDGEEQPSRFLRELAPRELQPIGYETEETAEPEPTRLPRALTLEALVAELRVALMDPESPEPRRRAAAAQLRRLTDAGVPGAAPHEWWGLSDLSDERPLFDGEPVTVSPSTVELVRRCSLRWLLERHGGSDSASFEQGVGNLVHDIATRADDARVGEKELLEFLSDRFGEIELSARWLADRERRRAEQMIANLVGWLAQNPRRVVAVEKEFLSELGDSVVVKGRVDRLEIDDQGRLVVIDLKTGKTTVRADDIAEHPQLGAYQAAIEAGAFAESDVPGGAALVQLGANKSFKEQPQPPLAEAADPAWAHKMVKATAQTMAASTFHAVANSKCRNCPVRRSCPVSGQGRQVTGGSEGPEGA